MARENRMIAAAFISVRSMEHIHGVFAYLRNHINGKTKSYMSNRNVFVTT